MPAESRSAVLPVTAFILISALVLAFAWPAGRSSAQAKPNGDRLEPVSTRLKPASVKLRREMLRVAPLPDIAGRSDRLRDRDRRTVPIAPRTQQTTARIELEGFEGQTWPRAASMRPELTWLPESLADLTEGPEHHWWPSSCQRSVGQHSLCAVCGGADGQSLGCDEAYPDEVGSSLVFQLDLSGYRDLTRLDLALDVWADAEAHEGLFINYLEHDAGGRITGRRVLRSATGQLAAWAPDQRVDLLNAVDEEDPSWQLDLSGQRHFLELLFFSSDDSGNGMGLYLDQLALVTEQRVEIVTPLPSPTPRQSPTPVPSATPDLPPPSPTPVAPTDRTVYCPAGETCGRLRVEAFLDLRCDGRFQWGLDSWISGARVDVQAGAAQLGTATSRRGSAYFLLPVRSQVNAYFSVPPGYKLCGNAANPVQLTEADFGRFGNKQINFRLQRDR